MKVEDEGYSISRGGITYIKKSSGSAITEQTTKQESEQTEQKKENSVPGITNDKIDKKDTKDKKSTKTIKKSQISHKKFLSILEFKTLENAFNVIYQSNLKRLKSNRATGILNALNTVKTTIEIIKKRGNYL